MRLRNFTIPVRFETGTGAEAAQGSAFPLGYSLEDFNRFYWGIKKLSITLALDVSVNSGTYGAQSLTVNTTYPLVMSNSTLESDRILNAEAYQDNDSPPEASMLDWTGTSDDATPSVPINNGRVDTSGALGGPSEVFYGKPWIRGYWSGQQGGAAGTVVPRMVIAVTFPGVESDSGATPFNFFLTTEDYVADPLFFHQGNLNGGTFLGKPLQFQWTARIVDFADDGPFTINSFSLTISPSEYFEFSPGGIPVYDAVTGAQLIDPVTAPI